MELREDLIQRIKEADEFVLLTLCMQEIDKKYHDNPERFVGCEVFLAENDPKKEVYRDFEDSLLRIVQKHVSEDNGIEEIRDDFINALLDFKAPEDDDPEDALSICMYFIMSAVDNYEKQKLDQIDLFEVNKRKIGPLNQNNIEKCPYAVYYKEKNSFLERANKNLKFGFRRKLRTLPLGDRLSTLQIIEKRMFPTDVIPRTIEVPLDKDYINKAKKDQLIKIAAIPFTSCDSFQFHQLGEIEPCKAGDTPKGPFYVDYSGFDGKYSETIIGLLDLAIEKEANIIVFPEFIMSASMLNSIKSHLQHKDDDHKSLWLVFAGTTYEFDENKKTGNNILHILNSRGREIASYYKRHPYNQDEAERMARTAQSFVLRKRKKLIKIVRKMVIRKKEHTDISVLEYLSDPGKEIWLLDVKGIGRILPAVCRDVIEPDYTRRLSLLFQPSMQVVPAWSLSVSSFDHRLLDVANAEHITSIVCNSCNAVGYGKKKRKVNVPIGKVYIPEMKNDQMASTPKDFVRTAECYKTCQSNGSGCIHFVNINVSEIQPNCYVTKERKKR